MNPIDNICIEFAVTSTVMTKRVPVEVYQDWQKDPEVMPEGVDSRPIYDFDPAFLLQVIDSKIRNYKRFIKELEQVTH